MILSLKGQTLLFLSTILIGMASGLFYDCFRTLRNIFKHPTILVSIEDILYWIAAILAMFLFMLDVNDGEIRPFSILGVFLGMIFYFILPSKGVMAVSNTVVSIIKWVVMLFFEIIFTPFRVLNMIFGGIIRKIANFIAKKFKKVLHLIRIYVNIKLRSVKHFLRIVFKKI